MLFYWTDEPPYGWWAREAGVAGERREDDGDPPPEQGPAP